MSFVYMIFITSKIHIKFINYIYHTKKNQLTNKNDHINNKHSYKRVFMFDAAYYDLDVNKRKFLRGALQ